MPPPDQSASIHGSGNIIVQAQGSGINVEVIAGKPYLRLTQYEERTRLATKIESDASLLSAYRSDVVPFLGRDDALADLRSWLARDAVVSLRVLIGAGGRGKTRLALEFARAISAEGWLAGFVEQAEFDRFRDKQNPAAWGWDRPTLVMIDYAADRAEQFKAWLRELVDASQAPGRPPLRILLIERQAQRAIGWLATVIGHGADDASRAAMALLDPPEPIELAPIDEMTFRREIFSRLLARAPGNLTAPPPSADAEFDRLLRDEKWAGDPLYLMMAGLVAGEQGVAGALSLSRSDLALTIGERELDRIGRIGAQHGVDAQDHAHPGTLARHVAVLATLTQGLDLQKARVVAEAERVRLGSAAAVNALVAALGDALPAQGVAAISPDIVGEAAVLLWLGDGGPIETVGLSAHDCVSAAAQTSLPNVSATLVRTAQDFAAAGRLEPVDWLDGLVAASGADLGALMLIADALPQQTLVLRERAAELWGRIADHLRQMVRAAEPEPVRAPSFTERISRAFGATRGAAPSQIADSENVAGAKALLAASLNNLGNRLGELGRREDALAAAQEASEIYRRLAAARPDAFLPNLAMSLNNLGNRLSELGRREDALAAAQEAVDIRRRLAAARPDAFLPDLAMSLNNLGNRLSELGRREDALAAAQEASEIYRRLAAARPDAFLPDLAGSLNNLGALLSELGRREDALAAAQEASEIYRRLAAARPDAFLPDLAGSLNNLGALLSELGRREDALAAAQEAVEALAPHFLQRPMAYSYWMTTIERNYIERCKALGQEPDAALLGPIAEALQKLAEGQTQATLRKGDAPPMTMGDDHA